MNNYTHQRHTKGTVLLVCSQCDNTLLFAPKHANANQEPSLWFANHLFVRCFSASTTLIRLIRSIFFSFYYSGTNTMKRIQSDASFTIYYIFFCDILVKNCRMYNSSYKIMSCNCQ